MEKVRLHGGTVVSGGKMQKMDVLIKDGKTEALILPEKHTDDYNVLDCTDLIISSGFVDIHTHGGGGSDYMDDDGDAFYNALSLHLAHGTTSVMPTTLSAGTEGILKAMDNYLRAETDKRIKTNLLGINMEGPYISLNQAGAQRPENIREFDEREYKLIYERSQGRIKRWCVAPEKEGAKDFADFAYENGIVLSIAHSDADFDTVVRAFDWGYRHVTHLYSGMSSIIRREGFRVAGVVEAAYYLDGMNVEIIADGCHLPDSLLKLAVKSKGCDHVALITDSMRAAGQESGESYLGSKDECVPVVIEKGVAMMLTHDSFGGSIATSDRLVRTMISAGIALPDAIKMITESPLKMMGIRLKKGLVEPGYDADITVFDKNINVAHVFVNGEKVI